MPVIFFFLSFFLSSFYLKARDTKIHYPKANNNLGWPKAKPGSWNSGCSQGLRGPLVLEPSPSACSSVHQQEAVIEITAQTPTQVQCIHNVSIVYPQCIHTGYSASQWHLYCARCLTLSLSAIVHSLCSSCIPQSIRWLLHGSSVVLCRFALQLCCFYFSVGSQLPEFVTRQESDKRIYLYRCTVIKLGWCIENKPW